MYSRPAGRHAVELGPGAGRELWRARLARVVVVLGCAMVVLTASSVATSWTIEPTPSLPAGSSPLLSAVSCVSVVACIAVGSTYNGRAIAETWRGAQWTTTEPVTGSNWSLSGVSCVSEIFCLAVGDRSLGNSGRAVPVGENWNGTAWALDPPPDPRGGGG